MRVALANYPITFHSSVDEWKKHVTRWIEQATKDKAELLVFPEYGSMEVISVAPTEIQQDIKVQIRWMTDFLPFFKEVFQQLAIRFHVTIVCPSIPIWDDGKPVNRVFVFGPTGKESFQDKAWMTRFENEIWGVTSGVPMLRVFEIPTGKFGIQICYDTEFPVASAQLARAGAQLIVAPSCTEARRGATRVHVGARARALENQIYVAVSQTIKDAPWSEAVDINFGYTAFYATPDKGFPETGIIAQSEEQIPGWLVQSLDFSLLENVRKDGQVLNFEDTNQWLSRVSSSISVETVCLY